MKRLFLLVLAALYALTATSQNRTFLPVPPSVYTGQFRGCGATRKCDSTAEFAVKGIPNGCCVFFAMNGDGKGHNEVNSYDIFLNGARVASGDSFEASSRYSTANVKIGHQNTLKVVLVGKPNSTVFIEFSFDPRQAK